MQRHIKDLEKMGELGVSQCQGTPTRNGSTNRYYMLKYREYIGKEEKPYGYALRPVRGDMGVTSRGDMGVTLNQLGKQDIKQETQAHPPGWAGDGAKFQVDEDTEFILVNAQTETQEDAGGDDPVEDAPSPDATDEGAGADSVEDAGEGTSTQEMPDAAPRKNRLPRIPTKIGGNRASDADEDFEDFDEYGNPLKKLKPAKQSKAELMMIDFYVKLDEGIRGKKVQTVPFRRELKHILKKDQRVEVDGKTKTYPSIVHMVSTNPAYRDWLNRFLKRQLDFQLKKGRDITRETLIDKIQNGLSSFLAEEKQRQEAEHQQRVLSGEQVEFEMTLRNVVDGVGTVYMAEADLDKMTVEEFLERFPDGRVIE